MPTDPNVTLPMVAAGAALALAGLAALTGVTLRAMPRRVAWGALTAGTAVVAFGFAAPALWSQPEPVVLPLDPVRTPRDGSPQVRVDAPTLRGTVRTTDGSPVAGAVVSLQTPGPEDPEAVTGADGGYGLEGFPAGDHAIHASFGGATFLAAEPDGTDITVAPSGSDPSVVVVELDSMLLDGDRRGLNVLQVIRVTVEGDMAFAGGLRLPLSDGAFGFEGRRGLSHELLRFDESDRLISDAALLPGTTELVYQYVLPPPIGRASLVRETLYPTSRLELLSAGEVRVESSALTRGEGVPIGEETTAARLTGRDLEVGTTIRAALTLMDAPSARSRAAVVVGGVLVALAVVVYPLLRRRRPVAEPA